MDIQIIRKQYGKLLQSTALTDLFADKRITTIRLDGLTGSAPAMLFAGLMEEITQTLVFVLPDLDEAGYFYHDLTQLLGQENVLFFPSSYRRAVKYGQHDPANEILRTEVLSRIATKRTEALYIVTYPEAMGEKVVSSSQLNQHMMTLRTGMSIDVITLGTTLRYLGFTETDYVYEPGQFALRGSILDIYSYSCEFPFRIDFFGDEIETIRTFNVEDQLSKEQKDSVEIVPELSAVKTEKIPLTDFLPSDSIIVTKSIRYIQDRIERIYRDGFSSQALAERLEGIPEQERQQRVEEIQQEFQFLTASQFINGISALKQVEFGQHDTADAQAVLHFDTAPQPLFHKNFDLLMQTMEDYLLREYHLYILADSSKQNQRLRDIFDERTLEKAKTAGSISHSYIDFTPVDKTLHEGFIDNNAKICFFTDHQIFDRFHKYNLRSDAARAGKMALTMKELLEMETGDYIVHVDFGIGRFVGLVRVATETGYQEVIRIAYQHNDKVDVSIHSLHKISKYRNSNTDEPPRLSTLGTGAWNRLKERAKKRIKDIARDLIQLYAKRRHIKGHAFSPDSSLQHELEASFLYEDTPDQLKTTQEVKADMESERPMDRLVCGDVGFGKTEIAVRAAFKAAFDGKQTAVLVPTTVLAFQHYRTFSERLKLFPVRVDYLSRARTASQMKSILEDLAAGKIDILVGTHKLVSKNVVWKDLGLLVIDEEQKFGVSTKEKLRALKANVDTLTMSATPIPRTLQFSLMGARDMSIMRTPPPNRYPVCTEIATFNDDAMYDAIEFEMSRNGQTYVVNNNIAQLQNIADSIVQHIPDCRVVIGHGQMSPSRLEAVIMGFMNHDYDVLLSTTIIENGIDIPNANTIIIRGAQHFGLSDLHQMRGRVGRSNRKAFCYLIAPPLVTVNNEARRRLEALEMFSGLGSGFNIAMQDLDIRGAGNLLGSEQSGFIEDLGYETYQKVLSEAVTELKNDEFSDLYAEEMQDGKQPTGDDFVDDCAVESDFEMYFPDTYVPGSSERMLLYRELDNLKDDNEMENYKRRLEDRFGAVPKEGLELMRVVELRRVGKRLGCEKLILKQGQMQMQFVSNPESAYYKSKVFDKIIAYLMVHARDCNLKEIRGKRSMVVAHIHSVGQAVETLKAIERTEA